MEDNEEDSWFRRAYGPGDVARGVRGGARRLDAAGPDLLQEILDGAADGPGEEMYGPAWRVFRNVGIALWPLTLGLTVAAAARGGVAGGGRGGRTWRHHLHRPGGRRSWS